MKTTKTMNKWIPRVAVLSLGVLTSACTIEIVRPEMKLPDIDLPPIVVPPASCDDDASTGAEGTQNGEAELAPFECDGGAEAVSVGDDWRVVRMKPLFGFAESQSPR